MKLKTQTIVGFVVGVTIGIAAVLLLSPPPPTFYSSVRIDGNTLKTLYNGNFSKLGFYGKVISGHTDLVPEVYNTAGTIVSTPAGLVRVLSTGTSLTVTDLPRYYLEHNRLPNHYLQLQTLVSIINSNPGGYFILNAAVYDPTHIYYQIIPYNSAG